MHFPRNWKAPSPAGRIRAAPVKSHHDFQGRVLGPVPRCVPPLAWQVLAEAGADLVELTFSPPQGSFTSSTTPRRVCVLMVHPLSHKLMIWGRVIFGGKAPVSLRDECEINNTSCEGTKSARLR